MSCSNQIICYTSPHLSLHVPFFFLLIILTHCYVIVYSFYYPPLQAYLQYKKSLSNIIHLSHRQIQILACFRTQQKPEIYRLRLIFTIRARLNLCINTNIKSNIAPNIDVIKKTSNDPNHIAATTGKKLKTTFVSCTNSD